MGKVDLSVIGTKTEPIVFEYTWKDIVLYNIGVGANEKDLSFVYENTPGGLKVLPSFCMVLQPGRSSTSCSMEMSPA